MALDSSIVYKKNSDSAVDIVINSITSAILQKKIHPGERLPPENELAAMMNVSRGTVREAMKVLSSYGILDICRGNGTFIRNNSDNISLDPVLLGLVLSQPKSDEIIQFRYTIEKIVLELASQNASQENIQALKDNYAKILTNYDLTAEESADLDMQFHNILGQCTGNVLIARVYELAMRFCHASLVSSHQTNKGNAAIYVHGRTIEAIENHDSDMIESIVEDGINRWSKDADKSFFAD